MTKFSKLQEISFMQNTISSHKVLIKLMYFKTKTKESIQLLKNKEYSPHFMKYTLQ